MTEKKTKPKKNCLKSLNPKPEKLYSKREEKLLADLKRKEKAAKRKEKAAPKVEELLNLPEALPVPIQIIPPYVEEEIEVVQEGPEIAWKPNTEANRWHSDGPQIAYLRANEDEVLFAGGRGSGKSSAMLADVIQWVHVPRFRALIIRRTFPELRDLITRAQELYTRLYPAAKWKEQDKLFLFPSGARIEFGYCDSMNDLLRYQGQEYHWLGVDEISQFESQEYYVKLKMSVRNVPKGVPKKYYRATTNPSGPGVNWVKEYWINNAQPGVTFHREFDTPIGKQTISYKWVQSLPGDNTALIENDPTYITQLASIDNEMQRRQWLDGDWDAIEGLAFDEFRRVKDGKEWHVVTPFDIPGSWYKFRACDWGYSSMAVCLWFAVDPDNNVYVYREYVARRVDAPDFAREVMAREAGEAIGYGIIDGSVGDQRGHSGPSIDEQMRDVGIRWRYADKSPGSRKSSKMMVHNYLKADEYTNEPKLKIFKNCLELIKEMTSLCLDPNDSEQVHKATNVDDHAYDALRYGLMSRPLSSKYYFDWNRNITDMRPIAVNPKFGY